MLSYDSNQSLTTVWDLQLLHHLENTQFAVALWKNPLQFYEILNRGDHHMGLALFQESECLVPILEYK